MNPRAAINDLLPFQGSPFSRLGTSPQAPKSTGYVRPVECIERRGWDSNPRALADKRFSRPPRYDHFDTSPYFNFFQLKIAVCISDFVILSKSPILVNRFFKFFSKLKSQALNAKNITGFCVLSFSQFPFCFFVHIQQPSNFAISSLKRSSAVP